MMKFLGRMFSFVLSGITACMLGFALFFSLITGFGKGLPDMAVEGFMQRFPETWSSVEIRVFLIALILLFVGFVFLAFAWIDRAGHKKRLLMFLILGGVFLMMQLFIAFGLHTIQNTDAFEVQDQALAIARGVHQIVDYTKSTYFAKYGNNDLYLIFCVQVFRVCMLLHIHAYRTVFAVLNMVAVDLGIFMTWRTVFLLRGPKAALKVFVLSVFNPLNILLICWPYTCTLSMPLMMLSLWMAAALLKGKDSGALRFVEFLVIGLTAVTAYYFRPTAAFPVIALILCGVCAGVQKLFCRPEMSSGNSQKSASGSGQMPAGTRMASSVMKQTNVQSRESSPYTMGKNRKLRNLVRKGILAVCVILLMAVTSSAIRSASLRLDPVTDTQFPTVYWLMLGASETGRVNSEDMNYNRRMYTEKENREADIAAVSEGTWSGWQCEALSGKNRADLVGWNRGISQPQHGIREQSAVAVSAPERTGRRNSFSVVSGIPYGDAFDGSGRDSGLALFREKVGMCRQFYLPGMRHHPARRFCLLYILGRKAGLQLSLPALSDSGQPARVGKGLPHI